MLKYYIAGGLSVGIYALRQYIQGPMCKLNRNLKDQVIIITGANTGIGKETARMLAQLDGRIVLACRSKERTVEILQELEQRYGKDRVEFIPLDLGDLESVKNFVKIFKQKYTRLDQLINNAGIMAIPQRQVTNQNLELQFGTNHLGHFALTLCLLDLLKKTPESRVINVSSKLHFASKFFKTDGKIHLEDLQQEKNYDPFKSYQISKLSNVLFTKELNRYFLENNFQSKSVCLHPGVIATELGRHMYDVKSKVSAFFRSYFLKDPVHGAQTTIQCSLEEFQKLQGGAYFADCQVLDSSSESKNMEDARKLWIQSEEILKQNKFFE